VSEERPQHVAGDDQWRRLSEAHARLIGASANMESANYGLAAGQIEAAMSLLREAMSAHAGMVVKSTRRDISDAPLTLYIGRLSDLSG
jgi:hypothetical protein